MRYVLLTAVLICIGCVNTGYDYEEEISKVVIVGYLYGNEPVTNISVKTLLVYGAESDSIEQKQYPVEDALVVLTYNGLQKTLEHTTNGLYQAPDVIVEVGKTYELEVTVRDSVKNCDIVAAARTTVPVKTQTPALIDTVLFSKQFTSSKDFDWLNAPALWLSINNPDHYYYIAEVKSIDPNAELIVESFSPEFYRSFPFNGEKTRISVGENLYYFGKNMVTIYKFNEELADLWSCHPFTNSWNEPPGTFISNIENGYGLFTALTSSDTVIFEVIKIVDTTAAGF